MRLLIVAEVRLFREGLAQILGRDRTLQVLGTASDAEAGVRACAEFQPDIALCGIGTTIQPSIVERVREVSPSTRTLVIGVPGDARAIIAWAEAGVAGYVTDEQSLPELRQAIGDLSAGAARCPPLVSAALMHRIAALAREPGATREHPMLTRREAQILQLIGRGLTNKEIASELSIEVATVKNHVHNILGKLGVRRRAEAAAVVHGEATVGKRILPAITDMSALGHSAHGSVAVSA